MEEYGEAYEAQGYEEGYDGEWDAHYAEGQGEAEEYAGWGEIAVAPAGLSDHGDQVNCLRFDAAEESLWAGTAGGAVAQALCPTLERYSVAGSAHSEGVVSVRSPGESVVSLSPSTLCLHYSGGVPSTHYADAAGDMAAIELDRRGNRVLIGRSGGGVSAYDLGAGRVAGTMDTGGKAVVALCGPVARGALLAATADGYYQLLDPRGATPRQQHAPSLAHPGGFAAVDALHDLVATAGYASRAGRVTLERSVKVFDVRMAPRMLASFPFTPGPAMLRFHPTLGSTVLVAAASGAFTLADASGMGGGGLCSVDTGGDALLCCDISPSGECIAFGGAGGYVHLWAASARPAASLGGAVPTTPEPAPPPPAVGEEDPFTLVPPVFPPDGGPLASDLGPRETMAVGLAPRVIAPELLASMKQSDFVGYIPNPRARAAAAPPRRRRRSGGGAAQPAAGAARQRRQRQRGLTRRARGAARRGRRRGAPRAVPPRGGQAADRGQVRGGV